LRGDNDVPALSSLRSLEVAVSEPDFLSVADEAGHRALLRQCPRRRFARGAFIFHAGEAGDSLHIIRKGRVAVLAPQSLGEMRMLAILGVNDTFGELAILLDDHCRTATIQAIEPTETQVLSRSQVEELRATGGGIDRFLVDLLANRVDRLTGQVTELASVPAPERVYRRIVDLARIFGATKPGSEIPVTQAQIASMAGVGLRITNRVITQASRDGLLETGWRQITVLNLAELRRRARRGP
jgi:CRP/FNR family transcriptional regulator, cyclic AMP receptor protein